MNRLMSANSRSPSWKEGAKVAEVTLKPGTRVQMVVDTEAYEALMRRGETKYVGNWATFDKFPDQTFARTNLAITEAFKKNVGYVVELEVVKPLNAQIGVVGPQGSAQGGANQLNFLFESRGGAEFFTVIGGRKLP